MAKIKPKSIRQSFEWPDAFVNKNSWIYQNLSKFIEPSVSIAHNNNQPNYTVLTQLKTKKNKKGKKRWVALTIILVLGLGTFTAFTYSPWPSAMFFRVLFDYAGDKGNNELAVFVPKGIEKVSDVCYDQNNQDAVLDLYYAPTEVKAKGKLPLIVWVHGGAWISGDKSHLENYARILAGKGFIVAAVNYSLAPKYHYPLPVEQVNQALAFLTKHANAYSINSAALFMAGDSAGSHIIAQVANCITEESYAELMNIEPAIQPNQLKGLLLHCGAYNAEVIDMQGDFKNFLTTVLWSYSGQENFKTHPEFKSASVVNYVTKNFPPSFISAGNDDPLLSQSQEMAQALRNQQVVVDSLFFPTDYTPKLPHEYQFNLTTEAAKKALHQSVVFMQNQLESPQ